MPWGHGGDDRFGRDVAGVDGVALCRAAGTTLEREFLYGHAIRFGWPLKPVATVGASRVAGPLEADYVDYPFISLFARSHISR